MVSNQTTSLLVSFDGWMFYAQDVQQAVRAVGGTDNDVYGALVGIGLCPDEAIETIDRARVDE